MKRDSAHEWKGCPNNKANNKPKGDKDTLKSEKKPKSNVHSAQIDVSAKKSTPMVHISKEEDTKESGVDIKYDSDAASVMMVQAKNKPRKLNGVTVIDVPAKNGTHLGMTILVDNGFTGYAIMSYPFAEMLGYEFKQVERIILYNW